jgi:hypothetical protein
MRHWCVSADGVPAPAYIPRHGWAGNNGWVREYGRSILYLTTRNVQEGLSSSVFLSVYFRCKKYSLYYFSFDHCLLRNILLTINSLLPRPDRQNTNHTLRLESNADGGWPKDMHNAMLYAGMEKEWWPIMIDDHVFHRGPFEPGTLFTEYRIQNTGYRIQKVVYIKLPMYLFFYMTLGHNDKLDLFGRNF